jgi:hypothetical protein
MRIYKIKTEIKQYYIRKERTIRPLIYILFLLKGGEKLEEG